MLYLFFIAFTAVSWFFLIIIFSSTTYHARFFRFLPVLLGYGFLMGYLFNKLGFEFLVIFYIVAIVVLLAHRIDKEISAKKSLEHLPDKDLVLKSWQMTMNYLYISSFIFLSVFGVSFWLFKSEPKAATTNEVEKVSVQKNVEYFSSSINYHNEATKISNSPEGGKNMTQEDVVKMIENDKLALQQAKLVDISQLNAQYSGFGDHYRDEFIKGLDLFIGGVNDLDNKKSMQGQILLGQWGDWYNNNFDKIRQ